jgi:hypothetical protein
LDTGALSGVVGRALTAKARGGFLRRCGTGFPPSEGAKELGQIRRIVAINLIFGLLTVIVARARTLLVSILSDGSFFIPASTNTIDTTLWWAVSLVVAAGQVAADRFSDLAILRSIVRSSDAKRVACRILSHRSCWDGSSGARANQLEEWHHFKRLVTNRCHSKGYVP